MADATVQDLMNKGPAGRKPTPIQLDDLCREYHAKVMWDGSPYPMPIWMSVAEQEELLWAVTTDDLPDGHVIEIGMGFAGSSFIVARGNEFRSRHRQAGQHVLCFDTLPGLGGTGDQRLPLEKQRHYPGIARDGDDTHRAAILHRALSGCQHLCHFIRADSNFLKQFGPSEDSCRLAFIDGDHTAEWAERDMLNILPLMKSGGLILVHDVHPGDEAGPGILWKSAKYPDGIEVDGVRAECVDIWISVATFRVSR